VCVLLHTSLLLLVCPYQPLVISVGRESHPHLNVLDVREAVQHLAFFPRTAHASTPWVAWLLFVSTSLHLQLSRSPSTATHLHSHQHTLAHTVSRSSRQAPSHSLSSQSSTPLLRHRRRCSSTPSMGRFLTPSRCVRACVCCWRCMHTG
jgi:hypothetical protein